jgi:hypothetical protein
MVRFAQRYDRVGKKNRKMQQFYGQAERMDYEGWSEDIVIPYGRQMICFVSDSNRIFSLDRNTGQLVWETDMNPLGYKVDYLLGIVGDTLYAAGTETIIAFDLRGEGRMLWGGDRAFGAGRSLGRGIVTPDAIYMPVDDKIWKLSLTGENGQPQRLAVVHVDLGIETSVGNLASDGNSLWAHQGTRLIRMSPRSQLTQSQSE